MHFAIGKSVLRGRKLAVTSLAVFFVAAIGATSLSAADAIQLRWEFEDAAGSAVSDSSGINGATLYNNPTRVAGQSGSGISLNGTNQYVQSNTRLTSLGTSNIPYALSAWVQVPAGVQNGNIIHISSSSNGGNWCIPFLRLQGGVFRATGWDGDAVSAIGTTAVQPNTWYQVLTTWDPGNGLRLFVDGQLEDSEPQSTFAAYGAPVYVSVGLGNNSCSENQGFLRGIVDDVRVYDRVIETEDLEDINNPVPAAIVDPAAPINENGDGGGVVLDTPADAVIPGAPNTGTQRTEQPTNFAGLIIVLGVVATAIMMAGLQHLRSKK